MSQSARPSGISRPNLRRACWALLLLAPVLLAAEAPSQTAPLAKPLSPEQQNRLLERDRLQKEAQHARAAGKLVEAVVPHEQALTIEREVLGENDTTTFRSMQSLAWYSAVNGDFQAARRWILEARRIQAAVRPADHWTLLDASRTLATIDKLSKLNARQLESLRKSQQIFAESDELVDAGKFKEAIPLISKGVEIYKQELGAQHPTYLIQLNFLGWLYMSTGQNDRAEPLMREALAGLQKAVGENHLYTATAHNSLGIVLLRTGRSAEAQPQFRQAADIHGRTQGKLSANYASSLGNLAETFKLAKDYRRAEALDREVLEISRQTQGENHKNYARALAELADVLLYLNENDKAEPLLRQALAIDEKTLGPKHPQSMNCLNNLAYACQQLGKLDEALKLQLQILELNKQILPPGDPQLAFCLSSTSSVYVGKKDYVKALALEQQALEIFRSSAPKSEGYRICLRKTGWLQQQIAFEAEKRDDFATARQAFEAAVKLNADLYGSDHWRLIDLRLQLAHVGELEKMSPAGRRQLAEAEALYKQAEETLGHNPGQALAPAEQAWAIRRKLLGDVHWITVDSAAQVSFIDKITGNFTKAEPYYVAMPELVRKTKSERHPDYADALLNLANLRQATDRYQDAELLYEKALKSARQIDGGENQYLGTILGNLAFNYVKTNQYAKAEPMFLEAIAVRKKFNGPRSSEYAANLSQLGDFYMLSLNDYAKAEPIFLETAEIYKATLGDQHRRYARAIDLLATCYVRTKRYDLAEPLYQQALAICQRSGGEKQADYGVISNNLACLYMVQRAFERAEPLFERCLEIKRQTKGARVTDVAFALANLAWCYKGLGKYAQAEPLLREALEIRKKAFGEHHPEYMENLSELAVIYTLMNDPARGLPMAREAVHLAREQLDRYATFQSERQQLASRLKLWPVLNNYIAVSGAADSPADAVYDETLNWKGIVTAGQQQLRRLYRQLKAGGNKHVADLVDQLDAATDQLATLYRASNLQNREMQFRLDELSQRVEQLQKQLAAASADFSQQQAQQRRTADDIRRALPADAVLIDLLSYDRAPRVEDIEAVKSPTALVAFIVRHQGAVERVDLGPAAPIEKAISDWRRSFGRKTAEVDPAEDLRRLIWQPLEKHVAGAKTLLISPNGLTAPMPWPALRIQEPDVCLLDQFAVAIVPVARLLPEILASSPAQETTSQLPSVLLVGDVDFGATTGLDDSHAVHRSAIRGHQALHWTSLPGTRQEVAAIKDSIARRFGDANVTVLSGAGATENAIRQQAEKHRYLHFSTHGFFAPPEVASTLAPSSQADRWGPELAASPADVSGFHPGLLSGLVLAGANRPVEEGHEDGILTALEVAEMDLGSVELATLSACETGLGATGGGEGLLGLQRAFQAAGAKTVIAGLWKVPDEATQVLMSRFYDNLWQKRMSKVEALREAQLWMLREGGQPNGRSTRGLAIDEDQPAEAGKRLPPYYWAAFVLSGDWR